MNRRKAIGSMMGAAAVLGAAAPLAKAAAEKSVDCFTTHWEKARTFTLQVADAMPADQYAYKPVPEMRGYGELMRHIGDANMFYVGRLSLSPAPEALRPGGKDFSKDAVMKYLSATFDYCGDLIKSMSAADLDKSIQGRPNTPSTTGWEQVLNGFIHTAHHRGYADVYLRLKGITPPTYNV